MTETAPLPPAGLRGRARVMILSLDPQVDGGRFAAKHIVGEPVVVSADLLVDGHDVLAGVVRYAPPQTDGTYAWKEVPLAPQTPGTDRWKASFTPDQVGLWQFTIEAWVDEFATWQWGIDRKLQAQQNVDVDVLEGVNLILQAARRAPPADSAWLEATAAALKAASSQAEQRQLAADPVLAQHMRRHADRATSTTHEPALGLWVDPVKARFSSWYELFPRSTGAKGQHGSFADVIAHLPYVAEMGFDVLYLPPIHPIGLSFRKGPNNTLQAGEHDPGSPWAIGAPEGGHKHIHPQLGTLDDFAILVKSAKNLSIDVALDIAFQASPDHPYVKEHPEWFVRRADGSIQYAENPPKKYQDVYPFALAGPSWQPLWQELLDVFLVWIDRGVRIFRVDNPHTKPLPFWQWCIAEIKGRHPDVLFLAEAFTRPKLMYALAKLGFSQSYTYFTWRTSADDLRGYMQELIRPEVARFFRPNFWPNTPDILPEHLQFGGRGTFMARLILAGTLSANYGLYGPAYELMESVARPGSEEYIDNEKFQLRSWDLNNPNSLRPLMKRLNTIRRENAALQRNDTLVFHPCDNNMLLAYSKTEVDGNNVIFVVVNVDGQHKQAGWIELNLAALGIDPTQTIQVHDLLSDERFHWQGNRAYVELDPASMPAHIFKLRRHIRSEKTFEYYL